MGNYAEDEQGPDLLRILAELDSVTEQLRHALTPTGDECACRAVRRGADGWPATVDGLEHDYWECLPAQ